MPEKSSPHFNLLREFQLFSLLDNAELAKLSDLFVEENFSVGEKIVTQNDVVDKHYIICNGSAKLTKINPVKKTETIDLGDLRKGDAISLNDHGFYSVTGLRTATVTALTPMTLLSIEHEKFFQFIQQQGMLFNSLTNMGEKILLMLFLKQLDLLSSLEPAEFHHMISKVKKENIGAGTLFFRRGYKANKCYFILSGQVGIYTGDNFDESKSPKAILNPNSVFGEAALFNKGRRNATALAETDCIVFSLANEDLQQILKLHGNTSSIKNLEFYRKKPKIAPNVELIQQQTVENDNILMLVDNVTEKNHFLNINQVTIWNLFDGKNSVQTITHQLTTSLSKPDDVKQVTDEINNFIIEMEKSGYITLETDTVDKKDGLSTFWKKFLAKITFK